MQPTHVGGVSFGAADMVKVTDTTNSVYPVHVP